MRLTGGIFFVGFEEQLLDFPRTLLFGIQKYLLLLIVLPFYSMSGHTKIKALL